MKTELLNLKIECIKVLAELHKRLQTLQESLNIEQKKHALAELEQKMQGDNFWADPKVSALVQKEKTHAERELKQFLQLGQDIQDNQDLLEMLDESSPELLEIHRELADLQQRMSKLELEYLLSAPNDKNNAILTINVGQGGVDSQDFSQILLRMYTRYAERNGFNLEILDIQPAEEAGIKSATVLISGTYAYGYLKAEIGVHRLVRISPFDSNARRHTSFSSVWVIPEIDEDFEIDIKPEDVRIDTYRAGGAGGQHVNKTDSAVRMTHIPSGIVVACQSERSQIKNRSSAMKILKARLYDLEKKKRLAEKDKHEAEKMQSSFGSQIRNYVMAPYQLVKDLRTSHESGNINAVLDGDIQPFIESYLFYQQSLKKS